MGKCSLERRRKMALLYILLGAVLFAVSFGFGEDFRSGLLNGMGTSLFVCGVVLLLRTQWTRRDPEKAAEYEASATDERVRFIAEHARSTAFLAGLAVEMVAMLAAFFLFASRAVGLALDFVICGQCVLYIVFYRVYDKKY